MLVVNVVAEDTLSTRRVIFWSALWIAADIDLYGMCKRRTVSLSLSFFLLALRSALSYAAEWKGHFRSQEDVSGGEGRGTGFGAGGYVHPATGIRTDWPTQVMRFNRALKYKKKMYSPNFWKKVPTKISRSRMISFKRLRISVLNSESSRR